MKKWGNGVRMFKGLFVTAIIVQAISFEAYAAAVSHSGSLTGHETWSSGDVHLVTSDVTVPAGINLTIESGTIVKFNSGKNLSINGTLDARGTELDKIIFTSYRDDSVGGDTNGDGYSEAAPGDWNQIVFSNTVTSSFTFVEHLIIRFAGSNSEASVELNDNDITITNTEISDSGYRGLYINGGSPTIENSRIIGSKYAGVYDVSSTALLRGNEISRNGTY
ncbi:MAG: right-handed parallel beta-helix repeat-containing protein, partial [Gammaproteobacteria bacterium]|nr:right-handed parallel beta-helix repeat-containing protein [Gammaproteobacteria bacterium]